MPSDNKQAAAAVSPRVHDYDLVFILKPDMADEALEAAVTSVTGYITGKGGTITSADRWGKKKLAYPLKHSLEGYYVFIKFKLDTRWSRELEANLQISENVLRHLVILND